MYDRPLTIEQMLTILSETPPRIAALTAGLATSLLHRAPNPGEWSANNVLAHLRSCADVWGNYITCPDELWRERIMGLLSGYWFIRRVQCNNIKRHWM